MDDDTLQKLSNGQLPDEDSQNADDVNEQQTEEQKPKPNYAFLTPTEAGYRETDPNKISAAPRPQPGMTFTPTGGSVSSINHQLNRSTEDTEDSEAAKQQPQNPQSPEGQANGSDQTPSTN